MTHNTPQLLAKAAQLGQAGRLAEAAALCEEVLKGAPDNVEALHLLGLVALQSGRPQDALERFQAAVKIDDGFAPAHNHAGVALCALGRLAEGIASYRRAVGCAANDPNAHHNLGVALLRQREHREAVAVLKRALELAPGNVEALNTLGNALRDLGELDEAAARYLKAAELAPDRPRTWNNLGVLFHRSGAHERSIGYYRKALELAPNYAEAHNNLGAVHLDQERAKEAAACFRRALEAKPDFAEAHINLGDLSSRLGRPEESVDHYRRVVDGALGNAGNVASALDGLVWTLRRLCRWDGLAELTRDLAAIAGDPERIEGLAKLSPFRSLSLPLSPGAQKRIAEHHARSLRSGRSAAPGGPPRETAGPLRIGYLSADFRDHPVGHLIAGLFARHDRRAVEVHAYAVGPQDDSRWRKRIVDGADRFHDLQGQAAEDIAGRISADGIDVLVDLMGYTEHARPDVLVLRPAPIQINWLGYPGTMGAPFMDYLMADPVIIPDEARADYSEQVIQLPHCYQVNDRDQEIAPEAPSRADCGLPDEGFVFCCFNNAYKIEPNLFDVWMRLLAAVPGSVLWLFKGDAEVEANLRREASARGVDGGRLVFAERLTKPKHLARHTHADLFLDTFPYNAHTTASDALWCGLPVVTRPGETFASRVAASLVSAIGGPELIAPDIGAYEALALKLATDKKALGAVRKKLKANRLKTPLFDTDLFARHLEAAYQIVWQRHREGLPPAPVKVPAGVEAG
ncbi:MAG: tetratricopeptide repeat protein [Rhodospirillales bacterium]|nr:tetratricopeptide repeat protein [Rhodospirillales bacterium]